MLQVDANSPSVLENGLSNPILESISLTRLIAYCQSPIIKLMLDNVNNYQLILILLIIILNFLAHLIIQLSSKMTIVQKMFHWFIFSQFFCENR